MPATRSKKKAKSATKGKAGVATSNEVQDDTDMPATCSKKKAKSATKGKAGAATSNEVLRSTLILSSMPCTRLNSGKVD
ncbi:hypothetical protein AX14_000653 [Amanita brunnescens Koide BX004]|nr:hypothetical protein AX14_000653 [Amanita brunnescens Koide BX004]